MEGRLVFCLFEIPATEIRTQIMLTALAVRSLPIVIFGFNFFFTPTKHAGQYLIGEGAHNFLAALVTSAHDRDSFPLVYWRVLVIYSYILL